MITPSYAKDIADYSAARKNLEYVSGVRVNTFTYTLREISESISYLSGMGLKKCEMVVSVQIRLKTLKCPLSTYTTLNKIRLNALRDYITRLGFNVEILNISYDGYTDSTNFIITY